MSKSHLPLVINASRARFYIIGGGAVAARKVKTLIDTGAVIYVIAPNIDNAILDLAGDRLTCHERVAGEEDYRAGDYVVLATDDKARSLDYYPPRSRRTPVTQDMNHTYDKSAIARSVARMLLEIEAVLFRAEDPFTLTSGMKSPVYIDCRKIIAFPRMRAQMMDYGRTVIMNDIGYESLDAVAGGETAGIPFAAWLAERTGLPMHYVRKKPKGFGRDARIEGDIRDGQRVLLVEDLATDGGSKLSFVEAIRTAGAEVGHTFVIFYYDIFKDAEEQLAAEGVKLHYLSTWWDVLAASRESGSFDEDTLSKVETFLHDPRDWSKTHGGA